MPIVDAAPTQPDANVIPKVLPLEIESLYAAQQYKPPPEAYQWQMADCCGGLTWSMDHRLWHVWIGLMTGRLAGRLAPHRLACIGLGLFALDMFGSSKLGQMVSMSLPCLLIIFKYLLHNALTSPWHRLV